MDAGKKYATLSWGEVCLGVPRKEGKEIMKAVKEKKVNGKSWKGTWLAEEATFGYSGKKGPTFGSGLMGKGHTSYGRGGWGLGKGKKNPAKGIIGVAS